jgi:ketosteroid isomerase-like protein
MVSIRIQYENTSAVPAGDVALLRSHWRLAISGLDGKPMEITGKGVQVARRQPDGSWRYLIDILGLLSNS